jgi:hypothetical protein
VPRNTPVPRGNTRPGDRSRTASRGGAGRPGPRTGTGRRPANPRLLRQRLFVFVVVTLLVAVGIAVVQGCQGPARGLGGEPGGGSGGGDARREQVETGYRPLDRSGLMSERFESTIELSE